MQKINNFFELIRGWSLPISIFSCLLPFCWAICDKGNILYGIIAIIGVIIVHMAANMADDFFDYKKIVKEFGVDFDREKLGLQKEKCRLISENIFTINQLGLLSLSFFLIAFLIGCFLAYKIGIGIIYIAIITFILSVLYSKFTYTGFGEITIGLIFCPLLYMGIYYTMTGHYSLELFLLSFVVMPILIGVLFNHTMLDFDFDINHNKVTLCSMLGNKYSAWIMLCILELLPYFLVAVFVCLNKLSLWFLFSWLSLPYALCVLYLIRCILNSKPDDFFKYFKPPMKLLIFFVILLIIAKIFTNFAKIF